MKHKRFSDEQVIGVLKEHEAGGKVDDICRRHAISTATFYTWRKKYGGMEASDAKRLRELEAENAKLKRIVADQVLDMSAMKELLGKHAGSRRPPELPGRRSVAIGAAVPACAEERCGGRRAHEE